MSGERSAQNANEPRPTARIVRDAAVEPLYPPSRLLSRDALESERVLRAARDEVRAVGAQIASMHAAAQAKCEELLAKARSDADELRDAVARTAREEVRGELQNMLLQLDEEARRLRASFAEEIQRTAFRFARKILDVEFAVRPERIVELVTSVLERVGPQHQLHVHVHPSESAFVRSSVDAIRTRLEVDFEIVEDAELPLHGVVVKTNMGTFWGGVEDQLRPLRDHLGLADEGAS